MSSWLSDAAPLSLPRPMGLTLPEGARDVELPPMAPTSFDAARG
jgi:hypothetical protein